MSLNIQPFQSHPIASGCCRIRTTKVAKGKSASGPTTSAARRQLLGT